jgi:hypothetical protein
LNKAFVVGNGVSRKNINLNNLKSKGKIYGCNALYREFIPDYLVAVDVKMVIEINKAGYQHEHEVWTNPNKSYHEMKDFNFFNPSKGWSSGPTALWLASQHDNDRIFILGFDYEGSGKDKQTVNNIYAGTPNYKKTNDKATYYGNWLRQTYSTIFQNPEKEYIRVLGDNKFVPLELRKLNNLKHISIEDFNKFVEIS